MDAHVGGQGADVAGHPSIVAEEAAGGHGPVPLPGIEGETGRRGALRDRLADALGPAPKLRVDILEQGVGDHGRQVLVHIVFGLAFLGTRGVLRGEAAVNARHLEEGQARRLLLQGRSVVGIAVAQRCGHRRGIARVAHPQVPPHQVVQGHRRLGAVHGGL